MENNNKKSENKRGRFNAADALIILIALVVAIGALLLIDPFGWMSVGKSYEVTIRYTIELNSIENDVATNIAVGDSAMLSNTVYGMGSVQGVQINPAYVWEPSESGKIMVKKPVDGKSDIFVTIETVATYKNGIGYFVNDTQIAVGSHFNMRFQNFIGSGYVVSLEIVQ